MIMQNYNRTPPDICKGVLCYIERKMERRQGTVNLSPKRLSAKGGLRRNWGGDPRG
jgi:hypothetical protein